MNQPNSPIIGIDLGTTNSAVAAFIDGKVQIIDIDGGPTMPSIVGITLDGTLTVGQTAKNQLAVFPERTIASVKRRMGEAVQLELADQKFSPQEISAAIIRRLKQRAEQVLGSDVFRAVITVPAFFDEDQRQATREAGQLAGLKVERIINEPTAASLVYLPGNPERRHLIVYDLGGGTFDVSIVRMEAGVVEVLSSKGDTRLGGDDFDQLLTKYVANVFLTEHQFDLMEHSPTRWRLMQACERAKCQLSSESVVRISEEFIATVNGVALNLDMEVSRREYEGLIETLVERTIECVDEAIRESGLTAGQLDELILVGGSTRTPLVQHRLRQEFRRDPKWSVNPDLAVALGAATQAAMQEGNSVGPVLIDVANHTLGVEALVGSLYAPELVFVPIIRRNSPLPALYEESFNTVSDDQDAVQIQVYQGESSRLSHNRLLGNFLLDGLNASESSDGEILVRFELTLDGILSVTATERKSKLSKTLRMNNALSQMEQASGQDSNERLESLFLSSEEFQGFEADGTVLGESSSQAESFSFNPDTEQGSSSAKINVFHKEHSLRPSKLQQLLTKARTVRANLDGDDASDVDRLLSMIQSAEKHEDRELLSELETELDDLLFYIAE